MDYKKELQAFFGERCKLGELLETHTTYRVGGPAEVLVSPQTREEWSFVLKIAKTENIPLRVLGFGSNLLVSDKGVGGILCSTRLMDRILIEDDTIKAEAGASLDKVCKTAVLAGLGGMEKLSGIPGSIGGAVRMNAGAFGQETFDCLEYFDVIDFEGRPATLLKKDITYGYRKVEGIENYIVLSAGFTLKKGNETDLLAARNQVLRSRVEKQPLEYPSAGSVFKRPVGDYASRLIDEAGLRGLSVGGAKVSEKHAGFIVNYNNASSEDIKLLIDEVRARVAQKFGIVLELEQILWGQFD